MEAAIDLMLCARGSERMYCTPDMAEHWASQGWAVYDLRPRQVAGPQEQGLPETGTRTRTSDMTEAEVVRVDPVAEGLAEHVEANNG